MNCILRTKLILSLIPMNTTYPTVTSVLMKTIRFCFPFKKLTSYQCQDCELQSRRNRDAAVASPQVPWRTILNAHVYSVSPMTSPFASQTDRVPMSLLQVTDQFLWLPTKLVLLHTPKSSFRWMHDPQPTSPEESAVWCINSCLHSYLQAMAGFGRNGWSCFDSPHMLVPI